MKILIMIMIILFIPINSPTGEGNKIEKAIKYTVTPNKNISIFPYSGTKVYTDLEYRLKLAAVFKDASIHFDLPIGILITIAYRESIFRPGLTGPNGELGIMQVGKFGRKKCKEYCTEIDTISGGIFCGACWFNMGKQQCKGDLTKAVYAYASGKCTSKSERTKRIVNKRLKLWIILAELLRGERFKNVN